jgi:thioesterase domain-containing protein
MNGKPAVAPAPENNKRPTTTIDALAKIWQGVFGRSAIASNENFFDLGGGDSEADRIFSEIAKMYSRELPSATIYPAPTIESLAALIEQPSLPPFSPFIQLKAGTASSPIVIVHGVGGRPTFHQLAKHMETRHPVFAIQAKGVNGLESPLERIEDMAAFYLDKLRELQSDGPYLLIGYSFGGLVALEMAQHLAAQNKEVALLALIDSFPSPRYFPFYQRVLVAAKRFSENLFARKEKPIHARLSRLSRSLARGTHLAGTVAPTETPSQASRLSLAFTIPGVTQCDFAAIRRYRPAFYAGKIRFVRPEGDSYLPADPAAIWQPLSAEFEVESAPGNHLGMVSAYADSLGAALTRYVKEALAEK